MKIFDDNQDALNMDILYFIDTFLFSQLKDAPIPPDFKMVENEKYEDFLGVKWLSPS